MHPDTFLKASTIECGSLVNDLVALKCLRDNHFDLIEKKRFENGDQLVHLLARENINSAHFT